MDEPRTVIKPADCDKGMTIEGGPLGTSLLDVNLPELWRRPPDFAEETHEQDILFLLQWFGAGHAGSVGSEQIAVLLLGPQNDLLALVVGLELLLVVPRVAIDIRSSIVHQKQYR